MVNLLRVLTRLVDQAEGRPYLISIGERAEALRQSYEDRQLATQQALLESEKLAEEYIQAQSERERLGLDDNEFGVYTALKPMIAAMTAAQARSLNGLFAGFPDYEWNQGQASQLRVELYAALYGLVSADQIIPAADALLRQTRV